MTIHAHLIDVEEPGRVRALVLSFATAHRLTYRQIAFTRRAVQKGWVGSRIDDLQVLESLRDTVARHLEPGRDQEQSRGLLKMLEGAICRLQEATVAA